MLKRFTAYEEYDAESRSYVGVVLGITDEHTFDYSVVFQME